MSRGNDAIPTWSGFNYQGKIMLLCVLEKINTLIRAGHENDICFWKVNIEQVEDFVLFEHDKAYALYQVKAWTTTTSWRAYTEAMDKLLDHRASTNNKSAHCYLVTARNLPNWEKAPDLYQKSIRLFKCRIDSKRTAVGVTDVKECVKHAIQQYSNLCGKYIKNVEAVYAALCVFLDEQVSQMHRQGAKNRKYDICFITILEQIEKNLNQIQIENEYYLKERAYNHLYVSLEKAMTEICDDMCGKKTDKCGDRCPVVKTCELISNLPDIQNYCHLINPEKNSGWDPLTFVERFSAEAVKNHILLICLISQNRDLISHDGAVVGLISHLSKNPDGLVIPTLCELVSGFNIRLSMENKLQRIKENTAVLQFLDGHTVIVHTDGLMNVTKLTDLDISSAWKEKWEDDHKESIVALPYNISFLAEKEVIDTFASDGGNHE